MANSCPCPCHMRMPSMIMHHVVACCSADTDLLELTGEVTHKQPTADAVRARFERDAAEWEDSSEFMSTVIDMVMLPSYQRIIGLGPAALPLIIDRMRTDPDHWFFALVAIAGKDVATGAKTVPEATKRWIDWYDSGPDLYS